MINFYAGVTLFVIAFLVCSPTDGLANEQEQQAELIRAIVATWKSRQSQVHILKASARVDSFYPQGYVSDEAEPPKDGSKKIICPEKDSHFVDEAVSWALDFAQQRVRKEEEITRPRYYHHTADESYELVLSYHLYLVSDGKSSVWCPQDRKPKHLRESGALTQDVTRYDSATNPWILDFMDLPLLWVAGGVSGKFPDVTRGQVADGALFSYRGEVQWKGRKCVVLSVPEQQSKTAIREFWVGLEKDYPIYFCRARNGETVYWKTEVEYNNGQEDLQVKTPSRWIFTYYGGENYRSFCTRTFQIKSIQLNEPLAANLFEKPLESGMIVHDAGKNDTLQVMPDGSLGPLGSEKRLQNTWPWITAGVIALLLLTALSLWWLKWRKEARKP